MAKGGGFGKAFADAFAAMLRLNEDERWHRASEAHWAQVDWESHRQEREAEAARRAGEAGAGAPGTSGETGQTPSGSDFDKFKAGLTGEESGGNYGVINKIGATGRYQIMPANIGPWTKQYLGHEMTQQEFAHDPQAQDKVFEGKVNDIYKKYGSWRDVASVWHSGVPYAQAVAQGRRDYNETTANYVDHVIAKAGLSDSPGGAPSRSDPGTAVTSYTPPTTATTTATAATPTKGPNKGKAPAAVVPAAADASSGPQASAGAPRGSYRVAGTVPIGLSEEDAAKSEADLASHRASSPLPAPLDQDKDLRPTANPPAQPASSPPLIQFGGVHPENILQSHPPGSPTLGPVFSPNPNGYASPANPSEHGDAPPDVKPPETMYDDTHRMFPGRPDAPMAGVRGNPQFNAVRPEPAIPTTPQAPNTVRPDAPMDGVRDNPLFNAVRPEPPVDPTNPAPIVNAVRPEPPPPGPVGTINPNTDRSPEVVGTINPQTDKSPLVKNTPLPPRRPTTEADKPTRNAQPVSATNPRDNSAIPQDPRFVQISAPNQNPGTGRGMLGQQGDGERQMTALDLSHLWGPNPPISQRTQASAPTPAPAPRRQDDDNSSMVGSPNMDDAALGMQLGARKGGPINRFAAGGAIPASPTTGFAVGGTATPAIDPRTATTNAVNTLLYGNARGGNDPGMTIQQYQDKISALTPDQQSWLKTQQHLLNSYPAGNPMDPNVASMRALYDAQFNSTAPPGAAPAPAPTPAPVAATPTPAPVAPTSQNIVAPVIDTTVTDPTTTTITGAPGLPNNIQAKSYDPNVDQQTGAGFANTSNIGGTDYTVDTGGKLKTNDAGDTISGFDDGSENNKNKNTNTTILSRKGGPITQRVSSNSVKRYDDGGEVNPSPAGMPPGLGGQGAIPPIYFNPATYAGAGAPVGKGITQNSISSATAGAIPSLPMRKGGAVAFADGGTVDEATGEPIDTESGYGPQTGNARGAMSQVEPPTQNVPPPPQADPYASATRPQDANPNLPAWTPQVKDGDGNPSRGVIGAIAGGLHYLASQLGLDGSGQQGAVARDPGTQQNRMSFARGEGVPGAPMPDHSEVQQIHSGIDPSGQLSAGMRTLAGMEAVRNYYLTQGNPAKADQMAASMMQYSVSLSQHHGDEAVKAYYQGDLHKAVNELNNASDAVGDGTNYKARVSDDGKHVEVSNTDLNGNEVWSQKDVSPQAILGAAIHAKSGALAWHMYEAQAAKYDPQTAAIIADRRQQKAWDHQEQVRTATEDARTAAAEAKQAAKDKAAKDQSDTESGILTSMFGGDGNPPGNTGTAGATPPALPGKGGGDAGPATGGNGDAAGPTPPTTPNAPTAAPQAAPPDADVGVGEGGYQPSPMPTTQGALNPNAPSPEAQNVSSDQGPPVYPNPAKDPRFAQLSPALQSKALDIYRQSVTDRRAWESGQATQGRLDQREHFTQDQLNQREKYDTDAKALAVKTAEEHAARQPRPDQDVHATFSTVPDENGKMTGKQPQDYYKDQAATMPDGTVNEDQAFKDTQYNKEFSDRNQRMVMNNALINGYRYTHDADAPAIADALRGFATNAYTATAVPVPADGYGQRYAVTFTRPSDGTQMAVILPKADWANVLGIQKTKASAKAQGDADTAATTNNPYRAPPPSGQSAGTPISKALGWQRGGPIHRGGIPSQPTAA